jgi:hypothetical protein
MTDASAAIGSMVTPSVMRLSNAVSSAISSSTNSKRMEPSAAIFGAACTTDAPAFSVVRT